MQWSLFLLTLMGQCSFFTCHLYEYHFIEEKKSWSEARSYCRDHYTDLATVLDETDVERLRDTELNQHTAWIGLHSIYEKNNNNNINKWQWSLPGVEFNNEDNQWHQGEPNDHGNNPENCVWMHNSRWRDASCDEKNRFICYDEKGRERFHLIKKVKTWLEAQSYCREKHTDLVSGLEQLNNVTFGKVIYSKKMKSDRVWIGLTRDIWRWSDGSNSSFRNWELSFQNHGDKECAMTESDGKWKSERCDQEKHFLCYGDHSHSSATSEESSTSTESDTPASTDHSHSSATSEESSTSTESDTPASTEETDCSMTDNVILIKENMSWEDALYYCRDHHTDLVSITDLTEQKCVQKRASEADSPYVWTGLRYTCTLDFWFWVSDEVVIYKKWDSPDQTDACDMSGAMDRGGEHKWFKMFDHNEFNFICF